MQSLDSSCQEADFIINDAIKKLKGSNSNNALAAPRLPPAAALSPAPSSANVLGYQQQPQPQYHQFLHLQSALQAAPLTSPSTTAVQQQRQQRPSKRTSSPQLPGKKRYTESNLLHCNIAQIPNQPPFAIFDDGADSPTELPPTEILDSSNSFRRNVALDSLIILTDSKGSLSLTLSGCPSTTADSSPNLSSFNSITSPSPMVPDVLLSTPPGGTAEQNALPHLSSSNPAEQDVSRKARKPSQSSRSKKVKKLDSILKRAAPGGSKATQNAQQTKLTSCKSTSPRNLPPPPSQSTSGVTTNKRQKSSTSRTHASVPSVGWDASVLRRESAVTPKPLDLCSAGSPTKFFNIHEKIKELYTQLLVNDLSTYVSSGLKNRTRSFVLERLVEREQLNTIVVNLYPGNKGYSLAVYYDDRLELRQASNDAIVSVSGEVTSTHRSGSNRRVGSGTGAHGESSVTTRIKLGEGEAPAELSLLELLRWPYENDELLQCLDREALPDFLMDVLQAPTVTLSTADDNSQSAKVYSKPNVFYAGCVVAQIRDFRQTFPLSAQVCDTRHVLLRPTNGILFTQVHHLAETSSLLLAAAQVPKASVSRKSFRRLFASSEDKLMLESQLVLATSEPLCLDPDPSVGRYAINAQRQRQLLNSQELRRQMKKYTQISINRKRKLDQFTHHYGLELHDYLARLRSRLRPGANSTNASATSTTAPLSNPLGGVMLASFASKIPRRPRDLVRPIRAPRLDYPVHLPKKLHDTVVIVEKYARTFERPRETTDCQPQLVEEYVLETEREDTGGRRVIYHIKLSILQRPSNSEYLGELYVDRDYREGERNGESCHFALGTRVHANRYIQQFTEIFTEEGRKAVKITHFLPGHLPKVTHTGISPEQRQALLQRQQQPIVDAQNTVAVTATITQPSQASQPNVPLLLSNGQQSQIMATPIPHVGNIAYQQKLIPTVGGNDALQHQQHTPTAKNVSIVGTTSGSSGPLQVIRQPSQPPPTQPLATQFVGSTSAPVKLQTQLPLTANNNARLQQQKQQQHSQQTHQRQQPIFQSSAKQMHPIQTQMVAAVSGKSGTTTTTTPTTATTTHQLGLSNGSLVLLQQHTGATSFSQQQQQLQTLQNAGITIQPANVQQQQQHQQLQLHQQQPKTQLLSGGGGGGVSVNSALRAQLSSGVPILQAQLKAAPHLPQLQPQSQLQVQKTIVTASSSVPSHTNNNNNNGANNPSVHSNPAINAIVTSIMHSANQWQQQQQQQHNNNNVNKLSGNAASNGGSGNSSTALKNSNNASILSLLNSAPAAMTSTPVASGTFTSSAVQQQSQHTVVTTESFVQAAAPSQPIMPATAAAAAVQRKQQQNEVLQTLLNSNRKINIVSSNGNVIGSGGVGGTTTFRTNAAGNLIAVNINQHSQQQQQQQQQQPLQQQHSQAVRVSMSALASQLASPPAVMTNATQSNFGYALSSNGGCTNGAGSIKILNTGLQQQRILASSLRRDSNSTAPPNAIVVGMAAASPGSDSNASNASGFAIPQATSNSAGIVTTNLSSLMGNTTASPLVESASPSVAPNQMILERLNSGSNISTTLPPNMTSQQTQQYLTKTLVQSPAGAVSASVLSPMSSPRPQPTPSPQHHQQQQCTPTATLNLQGINFSTLQGAMANFPGLQNVQVQIPGFAQPIQLQLSAGGNLQAAMQQQQSQHTITLQPQMQSQQHGCSGGVGSSSGGNQNVVSGNVGAGGATNLSTSIGSTNEATNVGGSSESATSTMLTLPIAQIVSPGPGHGSGPSLQKLKSQTMRTSVGCGVASGNIILQQQQQQSQLSQMSVASSTTTSTLTTTINVGSNASSANQAALQLLGALQQRGTRNIQVVNAKQLGNRSIITQRNIGGSTLKISATPISAATANAIASTANITATPILMSAQKLHLKALKPTAAQTTQQQSQQQHQQQQQRIFSQITATTASQTTSAAMQQTHQQQPQQQLHQQITIHRRRSTTEVNK